MKKLFFIFAVALSTVVNAQKHEFVMFNYNMSYAFTMNYDSLYMVNFGQTQEFNTGTQNTYAVDGTSMTLTYSVDGSVVNQGALLSYKETSTQVFFSFMDHGLISNKDFVRYGVFNKNPRKGEPKFILYYKSKLDDTTTVCHYTI